MAGFEQIRDQREVVEVDVLCDTGVLHLKPRRRQKVTKVMLKVTIGYEYSAVVTN